MKHYVTLRSGQSNGGGSPPLRGVPPITAHYGGGEPEGKHPPPWKKEV